MSKRSPIKLGARFLILSLIFGSFGIFNTGSTLAAKNRGEETQTAGAQDANSQLSGQLIANGPVTVNGNKAITGTTVFTDSHIVVDSANGSSAVVNLGALGRIELVAGTKMTLRFSDGLIAGDLTQGKAVINSPAGVKVQVKTPDGVVGTDGTQDAVTPVAVQTVHTVQTVPVAVATPAPARPIPVGGGGLSGWAIGGIVGAAGVGTAAAIAIADDDDDDIFVPPVSPVTP